MQTQRLAPVFGLPILHEGIPIQGVLENSRELSELATTFLDAGVIQADDIPEDVINAEQILSCGIAGWLTKRCPDLKTVDVGWSLLDADRFGSVFSGTDFDEELPKHYSLAMFSNGEQLFTFEHAAQVLEEACPGLFAFALLSIVHASHITVPIRHPEYILDTFGWWYWEGEETDETARSVLVERYGDDSEVETYLPSRISEYLGVDYWKTIPDWDIPKLQEIADTATSEIVKTVAIETIALIQATNLAKSAEASLPALKGDMAAAEYGCTLLVHDDNQILEFIDEVRQCDLQSGADDFLGVDYLPRATSEIKLYFEKLDMALHVLLRMDSLIFLMANEGLHHGEN